MVPHQAPSHTVWKIRRRWASQAGSWKGAGTWALAIQKTSTVGCMAQTNATEESPCASVRRSSREGARRPAHTLPDAAVVDRHPGEGNPRLAELCKVRSDQFPPLLPLMALRGEVDATVRGRFRGRHGSPWREAPCARGRLGATPQGWTSAASARPNSDQGRDRWRQTLRVSNWASTQRRHWREIHASCLLLTAASVAAQASTLLLWRSEASLKRIHTMIQRVSRDPVAVNGLKSVERHAAVPCQHGLT